MEHCFIVHIDVLIRRIEKIAQHGHCAAGLFVYQCRQFESLLYFSDCFFPMFQQDFKLRIKLGHPFAFRYGAYNHSEVFRFDALQ